MRKVTLAALALLLSALPGAAQRAPRGLGDLGRAPAASGEPVDVELILAVDVSWSMDRGEQAIQREGYVAAFRSPEVQRAILGGHRGRIAVAFVEWAGAFTQSVVLPWTVIDSRETADAFAYRLSATEPSRERRTSIAAALDFAAPMFDDNGFAGERRVIDVSGDGPNNQGRAVREARDAAVARGITINGLPLMTAGEGDGYYSWGSIPNLDRYYADCVIGGPGAFLVPVTEWSQFPDAIRRKLVLELAGARAPEGLDQTNIVPAAAGAPADCLVGETMWRNREELWNR